ncbi:unnamed protein product [Blepharisma stoltei]|uniref:Uncharacterized protein n=1 Tax=Blepharisma stoltei TaxID=1481888 RepID=A0AAU9JLN0_9CILI|nr:unnamed protein product [Blepharisma stoltei]
MSFPQMKPDPKSPASHYDEEISKESDEHLFEKKVYRQSSNRPHSAKAADFQISKTSNRKTGRPISAHKQAQVSRLRGKTKRDSDVTFLARLRPRGIPMDKERLYEDNMALKLKMNMINEEMVKLRTKLNQYEREIIKRDDLIEELRNPAEKIPGQNIKQTHLVANLKQSIKELRMDLQAKDEEINKLKKNIKSTRSSEMEIEIQAYIDECTRLRHHLEEVMRQRDSPRSSQGFANAEDRNYQQEVQMNNLHNENQQLTKVLAEVQEEASRWKEKALENEKNKKNAAPKKGEANNLKNEIQKLKAQLDAGQKNLAVKEADLKMISEKSKKEAQDLVSKLEMSEEKIREQNLLIEQLRNQLSGQGKAENSKQNKMEESKVQPKKSKLKNPNKFLKKIHSILAKKKIDIETFSRLIDKKMTGTIDIDDFVSETKKIGKKIKKKHVEQALKEISDKGKIHLGKLIQYYENYEFEDKNSSSSSSDEEVEKQNNKENQKQANQPFPDKIDIEVPAASQAAPPKQKQEVKPQPKDSKPVEPKIKTVKPNQLSDTFKHISLRMQLHRLPKQSLMLALFESLPNKEKPITKPELSVLFERPPFSLTDKAEIDLISRFLLEPDDPEISQSQANILKSTPKEIVAKLGKNLEDWDIFTTEDEEDYDKQLALAINKNKVTLKEACKLYDDKETGVIKLSQFKDALKQADILFPSKLFAYMSLLFYSHNYELDSVPYRHFLKAYGSPMDGEEEYEEDEDISDEERAKVVRHYLGVMAQIMIKLKKTVKEVFKFDKNGLISPDNFIEGLQTLGMNNIEQDHVVLILEALQYEESENDVCISADELEEILVHYGVPALRDSERDQSSSRRSKTSSESSTGHIKKVSLLESPENYEYSEDSPEKANKNSVGISESSPFASLSGAEINKNPSGKSLPKNKKSEENSPNFKPSDKPGNKIGKISNLAQNLEKEEEEEYESDYAEDYEEQGSQDSSIVYKSSEEEMGAKSAGEVNESYGSEYEEEQSGSSVDV